MIRIGMRVQVDFSNVDNYSYSTYADRKTWRGTVRSYDGRRYAIEFDGITWGHNCGGACRNGGGYWITARYVQPIDDSLEGRVANYLHKELYQ